MVGQGTYAVEVVAGALAVKHTRGGVVEEARRKVGDAELLKEGGVKKNVRKGSAGKGTGYRHWLQTQLSWLPGKNIAEAVSTQRRPSPKLKPRTKIASPILSISQPDT